MNDKLTREQFQNQQEFILSVLQRVFEYEKSFFEELMDYKQKADTIRQQELKEFLQLQKLAKEQESKLNDLTSSLDTGTSGLQEIMYKSLTEMQRTGQSLQQLNKKLEQFKNKKQQIDLQFGQSDKKIKDGTQQKKILNKHVHQTQQQIKQIIIASKKEEIQIGRMHKEMEQIYLLMKKFNNQLQQLKGNIRVYCRIKPQLGNKQTGYKLHEVTSETTLKIKVPKQHYKSQNHQKDYNFIFQQIFDQKHEQIHVFNQLSQLIQSAIDGKNLCIFAYGQTGSGKTYTMQGGSSQDTKGIIPRSVQLIFQEIEKAKKYNWESQVLMSIQEIYLQSIKDLLSEQPNDTISQTQVENSAQVYCLLQKASSNRKVASTKCNQRSSRSHLIFTLKIFAQNKDRKRRGSLNLIDLAGSQRVGVSKVEGQRLKQTLSINKSLTQLGVVLASIKNRDPHIPYRSSKLTYQLQKYLEGDSKCLMFVNISPSLVDLTQTIISLRFAEGVRECKIIKK